MISFGSIFDSCKRVIPTQMTRNPRTTVTMSVAGMWNPFERMIEVIRVALVKRTK